jgi:hypothetical protein
MSPRTSANVVLRYLLAREQLAPALKHVEQHARAGRWAEALQTLDALAKAVGVFFLGRDRTTIHTEWFSGLDQDDKEEFLSFVDTLRDIRSGVQSLSSIKDQGLPDEGGYAATLDGEPASFH